MLFSEHVGLLESVQTVEQMRDVLRFLLGNCTATLAGQGTIALSGGLKPGATIGKLNISNVGTDNTDNYTLPDSNGELPNGWALRIDDGGALFGGPVMQMVLFAKAQGNWVDAGNQNPWQSYVDCVLCTNASGTEDSQQRTVRVYLPRTATRDPNVRTGDILTFKLGPGGIALCDSEVFDGYIGEIRHILDDASNWTSGNRGWFLTDGANGTTDIDGPLLLYAYTGAGDYSTVGAAVSGSFSGGTFSGSGTAALTIAQAASGITVSDHESGDFINTVGGSGSAETGTTQFIVDDALTHFEDTAPTAGYAVVGSHPTNGNDVVDDGHSHSMSGTAIAALLSVTTGEVNHTVTEPNGGAGHSHTGTVSISTIAGGLSLSGGSSRPAGVVVLRIQRVS